MRGAAVAAIVLLVGVFGSNAGPARAEPGIAAVDAFFRTCMSDVAAFSDLAAAFRSEGWHQAKDKEIAKIGVILGTSKRYIRRSDLDAELEVFASGTLIAVISRMKRDRPLVGCYVYGIGVRGKPAKTEFLKRTTIAAPISQAESGHYETLKWGPDNGFENRLSLKFLHIVPGGLTQKQLGINGVALATTIYEG